MMEDREFFDTLFQLFTKTTGAEDTYWSYSGLTAPDDDLEVWEVYSVNQDGEEQFVGTFLEEADADFVTAVHGCLPDLVRRLHAALDEADRCDYDRDSRECRIAELEQEVADLKSDLEGYIAG